MTNIQKKLDSIIAKENLRLIEDNQIPPVKTDRGIRVGDVLISSDGHIKNLHKHREVVYKEVSLNAVAIRLANLLAKNVISGSLEILYIADQRYGKWFSDTQFQHAKYQRSLANKNYDKADVFYARYRESKARAIAAKRTVDSLLKS